MTFTVPGLVGAGARVSVTHKLTAVQKAARYGSSEVTGKLVLAFATADGVVPSVSQLTKVLSDGVANLWKR